jgi:two-component system KDP operon response regulator KdpE
VQSAGWYGVPSRRVRFRGLSAAVNVMISPQPSKTFSTLVVDDDPFLRKAIRTSLTASGFAVEEAATGNDAIAAIRQRQFDIVLLDINMPGMSGVEACRQIRALVSRVAIVMVTVRDSEEDKVRALEAGADDYVTKPFRIRELVARLGAVLRRTQTLRDTEAGVLQAGDLMLELDRRRLWKRGDQIRLTPKEFDLLAYLMKNQGTPMTHVKLLQAVWGPDYGGEREYLRTYVRILRKKVEDDPIRPEYILTEEAVGYRFRNPSFPDQPVDLQGE